MRDLKSRLTNNVKWIVLITMVLIIIGLQHYSKLGGTLDKYVTTFSLEVIAIACGIGALFVEIEVHGKVSNINRNISTRYLPEWPEHGKDLVGFIETLEKEDELDIQVDSIGYLSVQYPEKFAEILRAIRRKRNDECPVRIITLDESTAKQANLRQFSKDGVDDFATLDASKIKAYVITHRDNNLTRNLVCGTRFGKKDMSNYKPDPDKDRDDFIDLTMVVEDFYCNQLIANGVEVATTTKQLDLVGPLFWLKRDKSAKSVCKEMIFAYPPTSASKGYAFKTSDTHLMEVYASQFDADFKAAAKLDLDHRLFPHIHEQCCS